VECEWVERTSDAIGTDLKRSSGSRTKAPLLFSRHVAFHPRQAEVHVVVVVVVVVVVKTRSCHSLCTPQASLAVQSLNTYSVNLYIGNAGRFPAFDEFAIPIRAVSVLKVFFTSFLHDLQDARLPQADQEFDPSQRAGQV
jgi:hypothetical protein